MTILDSLGESGEEALYMGDELGAWFSRYLGKDGCKVYCILSRLLHEARITKRVTNSKDSARDDSEGWSLIELVTIAKFFSYS